MARSPTPPGYAAMIRKLMPEGRAVRAPMNPLRGLAFDADSLARYTKSIDGPILLVGHSYAGAVISEAAPAVKDVVGLVFLAAFGLDVGERCISVREPFPPSLLASTAVASPYDAPGAVGGPDLFIGIADFHRAFCADLPEEVAGPMSVSRPISAAALSDKATAAGWKQLPTWYMVCEQDNAISPEAERFMARRMNAQTISVTGSHVAFIAQPDVANLIVGAASAAD
jgi:pimeloyl-ACP methyl ester carboxylesterase